MIINDCGGGFGLSDEAINEFNKINQTNFCNKRDSRGFVIPQLNCIKDRQNLSMVNILRKLGDKANNNSSQLAIKYVIKKYANYVKINEIYNYHCHGENISYDLELYKINKIKKILHSNANGNEKLKEIEKLVNRDLYKEIDEDEMNEIFKIDEILYSNKITADEKIKELKLIMNVEDEDDDEDDEEESIDSDDTSWETIEEDGECDEDNDSEKEEENIPVEPKDLIKQNMPIIVTLLASLSLYILHKLNNK